jgi:hypothetical protein
LSNNPSGSLYKSFSSIASSILESFYKLNSFAIVGKNLEVDVITKLGSFPIFLTFLTNVFFSYAVSIKLLADSFSYIEVLALWCGVYGVC